MPLQSAYFIKLSNLQELITDLILYNGARIIPQRKTPPRKTPPRQTQFPNKLSLQVLMRTYYFIAVFPATNHWFEVVALQTRVEFSIIYIFITIFIEKYILEVQ